MRKLLILSLLLLPLVLHGETPKLPKDKELKALVSNTLSAFNKAVQEKNFAKFHEQRLSSRFREEFPLEKFTAAFQVFIDKGYDISNIAQSKPVFDIPPAINSDGLLVLKGHYPTRPNKVTFELVYTYASSAWKLMIIDVQATPVVENVGKVPASGELKKLTLDSLLLFNEALQTESFEDFYEQIAKLWQKQVTSEKLLETFQSFIDQKIDIGQIAKQEPAFEGSPAVKDDGVLVIKGSYPTQPNVSFELKYVYEDGGWKLVGINVHAKSSADRAAGKKAKEKKEKNAEEDANE